jgi:hypothetical protein
MEYHPFLGMKIDFFNDLIEVSKSQKNLNFDIFFHEIFSYVWVRN